MIRGRTAPRAVLAVAALGVFMAFVDATIVNVAFPAIAADFDGSSIAALQWVLTAYNVVFAAFLIASGRLADLLGRRRIFVTALVIFTFASALCAAAPSLGALIVARVLQAFGASMLVPASLALVLDAFEAERRAHAVALWTAAAALAAGVGPSLGGLLVSASGWRLVFLVNLPVGVATIALARRHLIESRAPGRRRWPDVGGAMVLAAAIAAVVLAIVQGREWGWLSPGVIGAAAAGALLARVFVRRCGRREVPLIDLGLFANRSFSAANIATIVGAAGFFGYTLLNVLYLTRVWGYDVLTAGLALTPGPFVAAAVAGPAGRLAERFGGRAVIVPGALVWAAGVVWFATRVGPGPSFAGEWLPGIVIAGIGAGLTFPTLSGAAVAAAPGEDFGTTSAVNAVARQVGAAFGVALAVAALGVPTRLAQAGPAFDRAWLLTAALLAGAGLTSLLLGRTAGGTSVELPSLGASMREALTRPVVPRAAAVREPARRVTALAAHVTGPSPRAETAEDFLSRTQLFGAIDPALRAQVAARATTVRLPAGAILFRAGDEADGLYVIRAGRLAASDPAGRVIGVLERGETIGELALLDGSSRAATIRAQRACELLYVARADFEELLGTCPQLGVALARALGAQLRGTAPAETKPRPRPRVVALMGVHAGIDLAGLGERLRAALSVHTRAELVDVASAPAGGVAAWVPMLDHLEARGELVLLVAGEDRDWRRFCLQEADRILAVASGPPDRTLERDFIGCDLVALDVPRGSGALRRLAEVLLTDGTHVLRSADLDGDCARLARRLTGNSVGLVLSGGGARALAHIGAIAVLHDAGVEIDRVAGVSMGALIGGLYALGMEADEIDARCYEDWVRRRPLSDFTLPRRSLIRGDRVRALIAGACGDAGIEELERAFFCQSVDLRGGEVVVHRHGLLRDAIAASICLPVLGPPQARGGRLLVDGGVLDNLPAERLARAGEGPVIAVDVCAGGHVDGPDTPRLGDTLMRIMTLGSANTQEQAARYADLVIRPQTDGIGMFEFHQLDRAVDAGRRAAADALAVA